MSLDLMIFLIVIIFILFTLFIYCYDSEERKKRGRLERRFPIHSFEDNAIDSDNAIVNPARSRNPNPNNIGFYVTTIDGPPTLFAPVGVAPGVYPTQPNPYPPTGQPPYPVVESSAFPSPMTSSFRPSAPVQDNSQPPSYYEATKHY